MRYLLAIALGAALVMVSVGARAESLLCFTAEELVLKVQESGVGLEQFTDKDAMRFMLLFNALPPETNIWPARIMAAIHAPHSKVELFFADGEGCIFEHATLNAEAYNRIVNTLLGVGA